MCAAASSTIKPPTHHKPATSPRVPRMCVFTVCDCVSSLQMGATHRDKPLPLPPSLRELPPPPPPPERPLRARPGLQTSEETPALDPPTSPPGPPTTWSPRPATKAPPALSSTAQGGELSGEGSKPQSATNDHLLSGCQVWSSADGRCGGQAVTQ